MLSRESLITMYKSFVWPHLDHSDIVYDQPNNKTIAEWNKLDVNLGNALFFFISRNSLLKIVSQLKIQFIKYMIYYE